jgi:hypothetical protein
LLGNGLANTFPQQRIGAAIEEPISKQRIGKHTIGTILENVFMVGPCKVVIRKNSVEKNW